MVLQGFRIRGPYQGTIGSTLELCICPDKLFGNLHLPLPGRLWPFVVVALAFRSETHGGVLIKLGGPF